MLALPGTVFLPNGRTTAYVRASFSLLTPEDVDEAVKQADVVVVLVDHSAFKALDQSLLEGKKLIDTRGLYR